MSVVTLLCIVGTYSLGNELLDVWIMLTFGVIGFFMRRFEYEAAPLVLGMVFGPIMERSFSQSLLLFQGNLFSLWGRPVSGTILTLTLLIYFMVALIKMYRHKKQQTMLASRGEKRE
jgi:putative tricarboxylic transport membrane protein